MYYESIRTVYIYMFNCSQIQVCFGLNSAIKTAKKNKRYVLTGAHVEDVIVAIVGGVHLPVDSDLRQAKTTTPDDVIQARYTFSRLRRRLHERTLPPDSADSADSYNVHVPGAGLLEDGEAAERRDD